MAVSRVIPGHPRRADPERAAGGPVPTQGEAQPHGKRPKVRPEHRQHRVVSDAKQVASSAGGREPCVENDGVAISIFKGRESRQESAATVFYEVGVLTTTPRLDVSLGTLVALVCFGQRTQQRRVGRHPGDQAPAPRNPSQWSYSGCLSAPSHGSVSPARRAVDRLGALGSY